MAIRNPSPQPFLTLGCGTTTALDVVEVNVTLVHEEVVEVEPLVLCVIDVFVDIADVVETPQIFITPNPDMPSQNWKVFWRSEAADSVLEYYDL